MRLRSIVAASAALGLTLGPIGTANAADTPVYMETVPSSASLTVLATAGDSLGSYTMPGIMDGLGALKQGNNVQIIMNHEISPVASPTVKRAGGSSVGATISTLTYNTGANKITAARDAIKKISWFDYSNGTWGTTPVAPIGATPLDSYGTPQHTTSLARFCSSSLAQAGQFAVKIGKKVYGYNGAVYFTGEESSDESRAFALNVATGELVQMPGFGLGAWETAVPVPTGSINTALMMDEDGSATDSQLFLYQGKKLLPDAKKKTTWYQAAGLTNGSRYVMKIANYAIESEFRAAVGKGKDTAVSFVKVDTDLNGKVQNQEAALLGTSLARVEDGQFDPNHPSDYYFVTTESNKDAKATTPNPAAPTVKRDGGALWRLRFNDIKNPLAGASITMLLDGSEAPYLNKPDNITIDTLGNLLIQEDPGNNPQVSRLLAYRIADGKIGVVAKFKSMYFEKTGSAYMTEDEESSGVIEVSSLMRASKSDAASYFLFDAQVHTKTSVARPDITDKATQEAIDLASVEGSQLYLLKITDWNVVYGA